MGDTRITVTPAVARRARLLCLIVLVGSLLATVLALVLIQSIARTYEDALEITAETAAVAAELADPVNGLVADVQELTAVTRAGLADTVALVETAADSADEVGTAAETNLADAVDGIAQMARRIADVVESIERFIPGDTASAAEDLDQIAAGLDPAADQLRSVGESLTETSATLEGTVSTLEAAIVVLEGVESDLGATAASLSDVPELAADLERRARQEQDQLDVQLWLLRILVVLVGGLTAAGALAAAQVLGDLGRTGDPDLA